MIFSIQKTKKLFPFLLVVAIVIAVGLRLPHSSQPQRLIGNWCSEDNSILISIDENQMLAGKFSFPYELTSPTVSNPSRKSPQGFVLDAGSMGSLPGIFFFEDGRLFMEIDGECRIFLRAEN